MRQSHFWQLKFYIYKLKEAGIDEVTGILEYPKQKKLYNVSLEDEDIKRIKEIEKEIEEISLLEKCPPIIDKPRCKKCSYYDFCYVG